MTTENTAQTVPMNEINQSPEKKENLFERGVKKLVGFIAKATGQANPETGVSSVSSSDSNEQTSFPISNPSFFEKLVSSTQNLLNKTEDFANKTAEKTKNLTQNIREVWEKTVEKTNAVLDKGISLWEQVKSRAETTVNSGLDFGKNLKTTVTEWAQKFTENPLQAAGAIGKGVVVWTIDLGKDIGDQIKDAGSASLEQLKGGVQNLENGVSKAGEQISLDRAESITTTATNFIADLKEKGKDALTATKEIWKSVVEKTSDLIKNPVEHLDTLTGKGQEEILTLETETENTTALENLEKTE